MIQKKSTKPTQVFYDGICNLCSKEISYYKRIAPKGVFEWLDIANHPELLKQANLTQQDALMKLHVLDSNSTWHIGLDAFICIWRKIPRFKWMAYLASVPGVHYLLSKAYSAFATYRFKKLSHCQFKKDD